ncbi:fibronectin-binding protein [Ligilactobacillus salitolerans]|uniref:Rqc2 homolog RqcH n=1 Tax=Ligilactobacillus salitolerans TaxID=1808352 RepID=A0A401IWL0_9LACO|nr:NFACT RNA binding domain-containing protein [Ligilactobacillus salitolerans]GBG95885.1 fibronectin-binding protein [Ligilactobacillus salitolerans]
MAFDGLFAHAMVHELNDLLSGGRVTKISQPYSNEVILTIRANRQNYPLLLSANPNYARIQITHIPYANPQTPTNFTMMLRKYLDGARITNIWQLENDRVIYLDFTSRNELGDLITLQLSIEIMGRHSNVILLDAHSEKVLDAIKHVPVEQDRYRTLLPGSTYKQPPKQDKIDPFTAQTLLYQELVEKYANRDVLAAELVKTYQGFSRLSGLILADTLHSTKFASLPQAFAAFLDKTTHPDPIILEQNDKLDFTFISGEFPIHSHWDSLSQMLDVFYQEKAERERVRQQGSQLIKVVTTNLRKNQRKLKKQEKELAATQQADSYRIKGEILTTYLYQVQQGQAEITLPNYYEDNKMLKIDLSKQLSPSQNAQKYFKRYQKLKNAVLFLNKQIQLTKQEISYLESIETAIELADPAGLPQIKLELQQQGYLRQQNKRQNNKKTRQAKQSQPAEFSSSDGVKISVGRNNLQNDRLTLKTARKDDIWLHVKNLPGSHVIVHSKEPSKQTLLQAAYLAAYFSKARASANVAIDYVPVRNIHKPNGAKPGYVIYEGQKTLYVTPEKDEMQELLETNSNK